MEQKRKEEIIHKKRKLVIVIIILLFLYAFIIYFLGYRLGRINILQGPVEIVIANTEDYEETNSNNNNETNKDNDTIFQKDSISSVVSSINASISSSVNLDANLSSSINSSTNLSSSSNVSSTSSISNSQSSSESSKEPEIIKEVDRIIITNDNIDWNVEKSLNIFSNPQYNYRLVVAPGLQYYYKFMVENESEAVIKYDMFFQDTNEDKINLKYKLKLEDTYLLGENKWLDVSELGLNKIELYPHTQHVYTLEWKWIEGTDEEDTAAAGKTYEMKIKTVANE